MIEVQKDKEKQVIFQYYDFIDRLVKDGDDFVNKPTNQWNYNQAESFYRYIDQKEKIVGFDFGSVNGFTLDNERGRMLSAWFDHERMVFKEVAFDVYLQIEFYSKIDSMSCNSKQVIDSSFYLSLRLQRYDSLKSLDQKGISLVKNKEIKRAIREGVKNYFREHPEFMEPSNKNEKLNDYQSSVIGKKELKGSYNHIIEEVIDTSIVFKSLKSLVTNLQKYLDTLESMS